MPKTKGAWPLPKNGRAPDASKDHVPTAAEKAADAKAPAVKKDAKQAAVARAAKVAAALKAAAAANAARAAAAAKAGAAAEPAPAADAVAKAAAAPEPAPTAEASAAAAAAHGAAEAPAPERAAAHADAKEEAPDARPSAPEQGAPPSVLAKLLESVSADEPIFESVTDLFARGNLEGAVKRKVEGMRGRIPQLWPDLPEDIRTLILRIADEEGAPTEQIAAEWMVQRMLFLEIGRHLRLRRVDKFSPARPDCFLALTERGSLITATQPDRKGAREIEYIRIPSRVQSWTQSASLQGAVDNVRRGHRARLPGVRTSPIQYILVIPANRAKEFSRIANVTRTGIRSTFVGTG